jgi:ABC-type transport system involved in multi-copper enzyme maturation permease subunit
MLTTTRFIVLTAIRDRLFPALIVLMLALIGVVTALSETAMLEEQQMRMAMSAGLVRVVLAMGISVFVCFHVRAMYDTREIDVMLSRPVSRPRLVLGLWLGFAAVASVIVVAVAVMVAYLQPTNLTGFAFWVASLLLESWIVVAISLFASLTNKSAVTSVMVSFTFYVLARLMAFFIATAQARIAFEIPWIADVLRFVIKGVSIIVPRLDMFAQTEWLVYGLQDTAALAYVMAQAAIFIPLALCAAIVDFCRKQF